MSISPIPSQSQPARAIEAMWVEWETTLPRDGLAGAVARLLAILFRELIAVLEGIRLGEIRLPAGNGAAPVASGADAAGAAGSGRKNRSRRRRPDRAACGRLPVAGKPATAATRSFAPAAARFAVRIVAVSPVQPWTQPILACAAGPPEDGPGRAGSCAPYSLRYRNYVPLWYSVGTSRSRVPVRIALGLFSASRFCRSARSRGSALTQEFGSWTKV